MLAITISINHMPFTEGGSEPSQPENGESQTQQEIRNLADRLGIDLSTPEGRNSLLQIVADNLNAWPTEPIPDAIEEPVAETGHEDVNEDIRAAVEKIDSYYERLLPALESLASLDRAGLIKEVRRNKKTIAWVVDWQLHPDLLRLRSEIPKELEDSLNERRRQVLGYLKEADVEPIFTGAGLSFTDSVMQGLSEPPIVTTDLQRNNYVARAEYGGLGFRTTDDYTIAPTYAVKFVYKDPNQK